MTAIKASNYNSLRILSNLNNKVNSVNTIQKKIIKTTASQVAEYVYSASNYPGTVIETRATGTAAGGSPKETRGEIAYLEIDQTYIFDVPTRATGVQVIYNTSLGYNSLNGTFNTSSYPINSWMAMRSHNSCRYTYPNLFTGSSYTVTTHEGAPVVGYIEVGSPAVQVSIPYDQTVAITCTNVSPYVLRLQGRVPIYSFALQYVNHDYVMVGEQPSSADYYINYLNVKEYFVNSLTVKILASYAKSADVEYSSGTQDPLELVSNELMQYDAVVGQIRLAEYLATLLMTNNGHGRVMVEFNSYDEQITLGSTYQLLDVFGNLICNGKYFTVVSIENNIKITREKEIRALEVVDG